MPPAEGGPGANRGQSAETPGRPGEVGEAPDGTPFCSRWVTEAHGEPVRSGSVARVVLTCRPPPLPGPGRATQEVT